MSYVVLALLIVSVPLALGHASARRRLDGYRHRPIFAMAAALCAVLAWIGLSIAARRYSEYELPGWEAAEWFAQAGKWYLFATVSLFFLGVAAGLETSRPARYRVVSSCFAVLLIAWTMVWRTVPVYAFLPDTTIRDRNGFMRQSNDFTCGPVSLANLAERFYGIPPLTEREIVELAGTTYEGTTIHGLIDAAHALGLQVVSCRKMTLDELEATRQPAIVFISTVPSVRHATLLLEFRGPAIAFVDPDRSYGYMVMSRKRFADIWYGKTLILGRK